MYVNSTNKLNASSVSSFSDVNNSSQNFISFQRILYRRPPPTTPRTEDSDSIDNLNINDSLKDPLTRSILIDSAARQSGFLPYEYRLANTFDSIRRHRSEHEHEPTKTYSTAPRTSYRISPRFDAFGNVTSTMSKLAKQRLILRDKSIKRKVTVPLPSEKQEKNLVMSDVDFATDIPSALEFLLQNTRGNSPMEINLFEKLKRERLQQARYRLLPINRSP